MLFSTILFKYSASQCMRHDFTTKLQSFSRQLAMVTFNGELLALMKY